MTEAEWLACRRVDEMLWFLKRGKAVTRSPRGRRKLRLFACACCRQVWELIEDDAARRLVEYAEARADGNLDAPDWAAVEVAAAAAKVKADRDCAGLGSMALRRRVAAAITAATHTAEEESYEAARVGSASARSAVGGHWGPGDVNPAWEECEQKQVGVLRDLFGNPFRAAVFSRAWRTDTSIALAQQMYASRDFSAMPILADALEDAGCDNTEILDHCRSPGPHVRGCWCVDMVLGKA
jgi:hypothetical protein